MKNILILIITFILGLIATLLIVTKTTSKAIDSPKKTSTAPPSSKFSLEKAPSSTLHGDITLLSGEVKWQSRIATQASQIVVKQPVQQGESLQTGDDGKVSVAFPQMLFSLSPKTTLNVIQTLPTNLVLEQTEGKVDYDNSGPIPLAVRVSPLLIEGIQSTFSVTIDDDDDTTTVSVSSGSATLAYNDSDNVSTVKKIPMGKYLIFDNQTRTSKIK